MPLGDLVAEVVSEGGQAVFEWIGEKIYKKFGVFGCAIALLVPIGLIAFVIWYFS